MLLCISHDATVMLFPDKRTEATTTASAEQQQQQQLLEHPRFLHQTFVSQAHNCDCCSCCCYRGQLMKRWFPARQKNGWFPVPCGSVARTDGATLLSTCADDCLRPRQPSRPTETQAPGQAKQCNLKRHVNYARADLAWHSK